MTAPADRTWRFVSEEARPGPMQMALDEVAAETAARGGPRTVRVYRWRPSTLSLGYGQDPATVDWAFCERAGIDVTRRQTGGGAIYHDAHGDVSYSIAAPAAELPGDLMDAYEVLCSPLLAALDRLGVDAGYAETERPAVHGPACYLREMHPAHDVVAADGRKLSGNAQYRQRDAVLQHGSVTFERAVERHLETFTADLAPAVFRDRVTSIRDRAEGGPSRAEAVEALETALVEWADAEPGGWTAAELSRARDLAARKYESTAWVREGEAPDATAE